MQQVGRQGNGVDPRTHIRIRAAAVAATVALFSAASASRAADIHWNVPDGNWEVAENWAPVPADPPVPAAVPGPADRAILDFLTNGTAHVNTDLANDVLSISLTNGNVLSVESGGVVATGATGASAADTIRIGDAGVGSANVLDGGTLRNNTLSGLGADIYVGVLAGGQGSVAQSGATSLVFARDMRIGSDTGVGAYSLTGGTLQTNWTIVGRVGGTGTLTVDGGTVLANATTGARLQVADGSGSTGTVNLLSGTINTTGEVNIGVGGGSANGNGTMTHTGGLLTTINTVAVGRNGSSTGTARGFGTYVLGADAASTASIDVNFTPAVPPATTPTNGHFVIGMNGGKGDMTMNGGTIITDSGFYVGFNDGGNVNNRSEGAFLQKAGSITVGGIFAVGYEAASGTMTMNGGTITATGVGGVGYDDRTNTARATLSVGVLDHTAGSISANGGFFVGSGSGTGSYNIGGAAVLNAGTGTTGDLVIGGPGDNVTFVSTRQGTLNIGGTAAVNVAGGLRMGDSGLNASNNPSGGGKGFITMTGGSLNVTGASLIGQLGTTTKVGTGSLTINGATAAATFGGNLTVGDTSNTNGSITLTSGSLTVGGSLNFGRNSGVGSMTMADGTLKVTGNSMVGQSGAGNGNLTINGGSATFSGNLTAADSANSTGIINVTNGTLDVTGALVAGRQTTVAGVITQSGGTINAGSLAIRTGTGTVAATDFNLSGGVLNTGVVTNNSTFDASGTGVANVGAIGGTGSITVADTAAVNAASVRQASLTMTGGTVKIAPTGNGAPAGTSVIPTYSLAGAATFDLSDNKLITAVPVGTATAGVYNGVQGDVQRAYHEGAWDRPGLTTSRPQAAEGLTTIAVATGEQIGVTTFGGQSVGPTSTIAFYTYAGDTNFDGQISGDDYGTIDFSILVPGSDGYYNGDFNYDGVINGDDYGVIDFTIIAQGAPFQTSGSAVTSGVTAVPEPAVLSVLCLAATAALLPRRRRPRRETRA